MKKILTMRTLMSLSPSARGQLRLIPCRQGRQVRLRGSILLHRVRQDQEWSRGQLMTLMARQLALYLEATLQAPKRGMPEGLAQSAMIRPEMSDVVDRLPSATPRLGRSGDRVRLLRTTQVGQDTMAGRTNGYNPDLGVGRPGGRWVDPKVIVTPVAVIDAEKMTIQTRMRSEEDNLLNNNSRGNAVSVPLAGD